mgnify:FL=1
MRARHAFSLLVLVFLWISRTRRILTAGMDDFQPEIFPRKISDKSHGSVTQKQLVLQVMVIGKPAADDTLRIYLSRCGLNE